jgi:putative DNA-invertase from lambdoid prophage Rac
MLQMFAAFIEFERNRIRERKNEGLAGAIAGGKKLDRPVAIKTIKTVQDAKATGISKVQRLKLRVCR